MAGQDEKAGIIDLAQGQYRDLMQLLRRTDTENPYALLPSELGQAVRQYEDLGAWRNSMALSDALGKYWNEIRISPELKPDIERIAKRDIFDDGFWGPDPERGGSYERR